MGVPENFHGKKGKSGRKSMREEFAKNQAIKKAWNKIEQEVEDKPVEKIALPLVLKDMVTKVGNPDGSNIIIPIYGGKSIESLSGHGSNKEDIQPKEED